MCKPGYVKLPNYTNCIIRLTPRWVLVTSKYPRESKPRTYNDILIVPTSVHRYSTHITARQIIHEEIPDLLSNQTIFILSVEGIRQSRRLIVLNSLSTGQVVTKLKAILLNTLEAVIRMTRYRQSNPETKK